MMRNDVIYHDKTAGSLINLNFKVINRPMPILYQQRVLQTIFEKDNRGFLTMHLLLQLNLGNKLTM